MNYGNEKDYERRSGRGHKPILPLPRIRLLVDRAFYLFSPLVRRLPQKHAFEPVAMYGVRRLFISIVAVIIGPSPQ